MASQSTLHYFGSVPIETYEFSSPIRMSKETIVALNQKLAELALKSLACRFEHF